MLNFIGKIVTAIITIAKELFNKKNKDKESLNNFKIEQLQQYKEHICHTLVEIEEYAYEVEKCLAKNNPEERNKLYNEINNKLSEFNRENTAKNKTLDSMNKELGIAPSLLDNKYEAQKCVDKIHMVLVKYLHKSDTSGATDELNKILIEARNALNSETEAVTEEIKILLNG